VISLACSENLVQNPFLKIKCRTGCDTAVWISLSRKWGL